jgi:hypothetical protein
MNMKYLCLIYQEESYVQNMSKADLETIRADYLAFAEGVKNSGQLIANHGLQPTRAAKTVKVRNGSVIVTDGPFAETKEQVGGFFLIEAETIEEATQIAAKIPSAQFGSVEVRPVWEA